MHRSLVVPHSWAPSPTNILLIEDDDDDAAMFAGLLRRSPTAGLEQTHARSMAEALALLAERRFDAILLDLTLPDSSGLEAVEKVVGAARMKAVILLTGLDDHSLASAAMSMGAQDYLLKWTFTPITLASVIRCSIDRAAWWQMLVEEKTRMEMSSAAKSTFLAHISHEVRGPLHTLVGMTELLAASNLDEVQRRHVDCLKKAGVHLLGLVEELLDLSRIEAGHLELERAPFLLDGAITTAIELVRSGADAKGLTLTVDKDPTLPSHVIGDERRLRQVLMNLVSNAIKFTECGFVRVEVRAVGEVVRFRIIDSGIGIARDRQRSVFLNFEQADSGIAHSYGGYGLGLSIAKRIVELMGGTIEVESELGRGSTFSFGVIFQRGHPGGRPAPTPRRYDTSSRLAVRRRSERLRLLLVDDSPESKALVDAYLADEPISIQHVDGGAAAVRAFQQEPFDLVLMDMWMPGMSGLDATRAIRAIETSRGQEPVPIVALTADAMRDSVGRAREAGCTDHLAKPFTKEELLTTVARHARQSQGAQGMVSVPVHHDPVRALSPEVRALLPRFLDKRRADVAALRAALERRDFAAMRPSAHNMIGNGAPYGLPRVSELGREISKAASNGDVVTLGALIDELAKLVETTSLACQGRPPSGARARATPGFHIRVNVDPATRAGNKGGRS